MQKNRYLLTFLFITLLVFSSLMTYPVFAADLAPTFEIATHTGIPGGTIEVPILVKNNPGIAALKMKVAYDDTRLELTKITYGDWSGNFQLPQKMSSPVSLTWYNGTENYNVADSTFATLTFCVLENAEPGDTEISITYDPNNVYNIQEDNIAFSTITGKITVMQQEAINTPTFEIATHTGISGNTIEVPILVKNNPGIAALKMKVAYDDTKLELTKITYGDWGGNFQLPQKLSNPVSLTWYNGTENYNVADSTFATLTFRVLENVEPGDTEISITYDPNNVYNILESNIDFAVQNGKVNIKDGGTPQINLQWQDNKKILTVSGEPGNASYIYIAIYSADNQMVNAVCYTPEEIRGGISLTNTESDSTNCYATTFVLNQYYIPMTAAITVE